MASAISWCSNYLHSYSSLSLRDLKSERQISKIRVSSQGFQKIICVQSLVYCNYLISLAIEISNCRKTMNEISDLRWKWYFTLHFRVRLTTVKEAFAFIARCLTDLLPEHCRGHVTVLIGLPQQSAFQQLIQKPTAHLKVKECGFILFSFQMTDTCSCPASREDGVSKGCALYEHWHYLTTRFSTTVGFTVQIWHEPAENRALPHSNKEQVSLLTSAILHTSLWLVKDGHLQSLATWLEFYIKTEKPKKGREKKIKK